MLPAFSILIGFFLIVAGNKFLGRPDEMYLTGIAMMVGGGALIVSGLWMIGARERRRIRARHQHGFDVLPRNGCEPSGRDSR